MGHGASRSYAVSQDRKPSVCIPIADLLSRVKVFQDSSGEVLIVLDEDVKNVVNSMEGAVICTYHNSQKKYYDTMLKACDNFHDDSTLTTAGITCDASLPMTEANYSRNMLKNQVMTKSGKGKNVKDNSYGDDKHDRLRPEEAKNGSPSSKEHHATKLTPVAYSPPSSKWIHNDLTQDARIQSMMKGKRNKSGGISGSNHTEEFKSFDGDHFSSHRIGSGKQQKFPTRCNICNEWFPESAQLDLIQEHIEVCQESYEIKKAMDAINEHLQPSLSELSQSNHLMVREILYNAISAACAEIDDCDSLNNRVQLLARRVVNINHTSTSDGRPVTILRRDIVNQLNDILAMIDTEKMAENPDKEFLGDLVYFRNLLDDCLNQLKEKTGILLKYRKTQMKASDFKFIRALGRGGFGSVYLAQRTNSLKLYAVKVMNKLAIKSVNFELQVLRERKALTKALEYPDHFIRIQGSFQTSEDLFLVMEYVPGGDCMTLLMSLRQFPEHVAQHIIAQVCVAVKHLHMHGVVHRDIKPDNVLITKQGHVKLADFGLVAPFTRQSSGTSDSEESGNYSIGNTLGTRQRRSSAVTTGDATGTEEQWLDDDGDIINPETVPRVYNSSSSLILSKPNYKLEQVGNYNYSSPEMVIRSPYDHTVDWWSVGVMLFHFVAGVTPFDDVSRDKVHENIVLFNVQWHLLPAHVSSQCRDFIEGIITKTVEYRLGYKSSDHVLSHPFFDDINFKTLYAQMGPYYPQIEGKNGKEFHVFATLTEEEAYDLPDFSSKQSDDDLNDEFVHYNYFR